MASVWRRIRKTQKRNLRIKFVEIIEDIGPLPKGVYQILDIHEEGFGCYFEGIWFGVFAGGEELYRYLASNEEVNLTSREAFLSAYQSNYKERRKNIRYSIFNPFEPITFCSIDSSLWREEEERSLSLGSSWEGSYLN